MCTPGYVILTSQYKPDDATINIESLSIMVLVWDKKGIMRIYEFKSALI